MRIALTGMWGRFPVRLLQVLPLLIDRNTWPPPKAEQLVHMTFFEAPRTTISLTNSLRGLVSCVTFALAHPEQARSMRARRPVSVPRNMVLGLTMLTAETFSPASPPKSTSVQLFPLSSDTKSVTPALATIVSTTSMGG